MTKAAFLDRDGTINVDKGYVHKVEDFEFITGIFDLCRLFRDRQYKIVIISNQSGIGRGYFTEDQLNDLNEWIEGRFNNQGISISKFYFCPHHPTKGIGQFKKACDCRKPQPGMILRAQKELNLNLKESLLVGDQPTDVQAGTNAGIKQNFLIGHPHHLSKALNSCHLFENLSDLTHFLRS